MTRSNSPKFIYFLLVFMLILLPNILIAQSTLLLNYDNSGNQIYRGFGLDTESTGAEDTIKKKVTTLSMVEPKNSNGSSDNFDDGTFAHSINYHPNPVQNDLMVSWDLSKDIYVTRILLLNMNGKVLKRFVITNRDIYSKGIDFSNYSSGMYIIILKYSNNRSEKLHILKK